MEEIENVNPWDCLKSIESVTTMKNDPLFSCIITLYILVLLYFPHRVSLKILFSPILVLTASLLLSLLRLGAIQRMETETETVEKLTEPEDEKSELKWETTCKKDPDIIMQSFEERFVEWDVRAPLEVIYEEYEGEEEGKDPNRTHGIERYPSLSLYYPESDSDSASSSSDMDFTTIGDWVSSEKMGYRWEEEDREGLIEIELDKRDLDFHGEDDNLIEIDIS